MEKQTFLQRLEEIVEEKDGDWGELATQLGMYKINLLVIRDGLSRPKNRVRLSTIKRMGVSLRLVPVTLYSELKGQFEYSEFLDPATKKLVEDYEARVMREHRLLLRLPQLELSKNTGVHTTIIQRYELGTITDISIRNFEALCPELKLVPVYLR